MYALFRNLITTCIECMCQNLGVQKKGTVLNCGNNDFLFCFTDAAELLDSEKTIYICPGVTYAVSCTQRTNSENTEITPPVFYKMNQTSQQPVQLSSPQFDIASGQKTRSGSTTKQKFYLILDDLKSDNDGGKFTCLNDISVQLDVNVISHFDRGDCVTIRVLPQEGRWN